MLKGKVSYPARDAASILCHVLNKGLEFPYLHGEVILSPKDQDRFFSLVRRRAEGEPLAYIKGHKEFMGFDFKVDRRVLIPRPETEILVETAVDLLKRQLKETERSSGRRASIIVADIGCGSGVIGLSLLKLLPSVRAVLTDISEDALCVARENAKRLGVEDRATFLSGDLFEPLQRLTGNLPDFPGPFNPQSSHGPVLFDAILSNPPYVSCRDYPLLDPGILNYEPKSALFGGKDGMEIVKRLILEAPFYLKSNGYLAIEVGYDQADAVRKVFQSAESISPGGETSGTGDSKAVGTCPSPGRVWKRYWSVRDYAGHERVFVGQVA